MRFLFALAMVSMLPSLAAAQLDEGRRLLEEADFEGAIAALDRAEQMDGLTREEIVSIFEARAIARRANGDDEGARLDLEALASLDPAHVFPPEAPPELETDLRALAAEPLAVAVEWGDEAGDVIVHANVTGDPRGLVTTIVVWTRNGSAPWRRASGPSVTIDAPHGGRVEAYVEAIGPGGAVIASDGSRASPLTHTAGGPARTSMITTTPRDDTLLHVAIGASAGAVALIVIISVAVGVVVTQPNNQTQIEGPVIVGF